jgi:hypothetical protein
MSASLEQHLTQRTLQYFERLAVLDIQGLLELLTPDCEHHYAPSSTQLPSPLNNAAYEKHVTFMNTVLTGFPIGPKPGELHVNVEKRQVTLWCTGKTAVKPELRDDSEPAEWWEYTSGEYFHHFIFDDAGDKISRVVEFLDSLQTERLKAMFGKALANFAAKQESK